MKKETEIKRILVPTDFSDTGMLALEQAAWMARLFRAELHLMHVIEVMEFTYNTYDPDNMLRDEIEIDEVVEERLHDIQSKISRQYSISSNIIIGKGRVAHSISDVVEEYGIDLIVMGTHGAKGFEEYFIGSNAYKTVNMVHCPVITVQEHARKKGFDTIVLPIDNHLHSRQKVDLVIELARRNHSFVHILGLLNIHEDVDEKKFDIKIESVERALERAGLAYETSIVKGDNLADEALEYSEKVKADLIAIMTGHESSMNGTFLGSLAKKIINHSRIPILSIRPLEDHYANFELGAGGNPFNGV